MRPARGAESGGNEAPPRLSMAARARGAAQGGPTRVLYKLRLGPSLMGTSRRLALDSKRGHGWNGYTVFILYFNKIITATTRSHKPIQYTSKILFFIHRGGVSASQGEGWGSTVGRNVKTEFIQVTNNLINR